MCSLWVWDPIWSHIKLPYIDRTYSVLSVKGKKVLHIDRNDHYGAYVLLGMSQLVELI